MKFMLLMKYVIPGLLQVIPPEEWEKPTQPIVEQVKLQPLTQIVTPTAEPGVYHQRCCKAKGTTVKQFASLYTYRCVLVHLDMSSLLQ